MTSGGYPSVPTVTPCAGNSLPKLNTDDNEDDKEIAAAEAQCDQEAHLMDQAFKEEDCVEIEIDDNDDLPPSDDDDDGDDDMMDGGEVGVVDADESDEEFSGVDDSRATVTHGNAVLAVAGSGTDNSLFVTGGQDDVAIMWKIKEVVQPETQQPGLACDEVVRLTGHTDSVTSVGFSYDGQFVATSSYDGSVKVWKCTQGAMGELLHTLEGPSKEVEWMLWHPKGHVIIAGSLDSTAWMWWAPTGKVMQVFAGHADAVTCGCWVNQGKLIATGSTDNGAIIWNPRTGQPAQSFRSLHDGGVVAATAHGELPLVATGSEDASAKVVHAETGKIVATLSGHTDTVEALAFNNPENPMQFLATGSMDGKVQIWDCKTWELRCALTDHGDSGIIRCKWLNTLAYNNFLCTCSTDKTLRLFDALGGRLEKVLRGHTDQVVDLDVAIITGDGCNHLRILSGSDDKSCKLFMLPVASQGQQIPHPPS